jgi:hypothetical protein
MALRGTEREHFPCRRNLTAWSMTLFVGSIPNLLQIRLIEKVSLSNIYLEPKYVDPGVYTSL